VNWLKRLIVWLLSLFDRPSPIPEPFKVPDIPVAEGLPASMPIPGVQTAVPPVEYYGVLSDAITKFSANVLQPGDKGGLVGIVVRRPDGTINTNLAIVKNFGKKVDVVTWIGKEGSWGNPAGFEGGIAFKARW